METSTIVFFSSRKSWEERNRLSRPVKAGYLGRLLLRRLDGGGFDVPEALGVLEDGTIRAELAHLLRS